MKLPSVRRLSQEALDTYQRFPFAIFSAIVATGAVIVLAQNEFTTSGFYVSLYNAVLVGYLGISIFTALQLVGERFQWPVASLVGVKIGLLAFMLVYYLVLPKNIFEPPIVHLIRFWLIAVAAHLCVAALPFLEREHEHRFWEFNKSLFLRYITGFLYAVVFFVGLAIALAAISHLFNVDIHAKRYFQLWWFLFGIFSTWFFLSGVPRNLQSLDADIAYPQGLKVFTQYVLLPLVVIYLLILYSYTGKIIIEWDWPKGWVGYLVLGFATTGIFSLLLVHPIKDRLENAWMAAVSRRFYIVIVPLVILLLLAIWRRISEYGMTERRYMVIVLGLWLLVLCFYFIFSAAKNIKVIPASLGILAIVTSFGPWSAFDISERNQVHRLEQVLERNHILADGKIHKATSAVPFDDARKISAIVRYLAEVHGYASIQPWFDVALDSVKRPTRVTRWDPWRESASQVVKHLGVRYVSEWEKEGAPASHLYNVATNLDEVVPSKGYDYLVPAVELSEWKNTSFVTVNDRRWRVELVADSMAIRVTPLDSPGEAISFNLNPTVPTLIKQDSEGEKNTTVPQKVLEFAAEGRQLRGKAVVRSLAVRSDSARYKLISASVSLLLKPRR